MAKIKEGIRGSISGSIGNVVGSSWNGIPYIKSKPRKRTSPLSEREQLTRLHFKMVHDWLQPLLDFVRVGFKGYSPTNYGFNAAKSVLRKEALVKDGFDSWIDPGLARVSFGDLGMSANMSVELKDTRELEFTWDPASSKDMGPGDQVMMLAYDPIQKEYNFRTAGALRSAGRDLLDLGHLPSGTYHVYAAFVAEDRSRQSNSVYLGPVELPGKEA